MTNKKLMSTHNVYKCALYIDHVLFKERAGTYYQVEKLEVSFLNGFKISDTDQFTVALIFRFGVILV